jgi:hypothetical protein
MVQPPDASRRRALLVALLFLVVVGPWVKDLTAQPSSRLALTGAIVDHGTIRIDAYESIIGVDRVEREGHLYSDKAPGQPFLAVPFYAAARAVGAEPADVPRAEGNLTLWWITFWSSVIPGALIVLLMARLCRDDEATLGVVSTVAIGFGTLLMPFSGELYGHVLATSLGVAAWVAIRRQRTTRRVLLAGALAGLAVLVEYQMVLFVAVIAVYLLVRGGGRALAWFAAAGVPSAALLLLYQAAAFGSPFRSSYGEKPVHDEGGATIVGLPDPQQALEVLFGARGLLVFAPVVGLGVVGLVVIARRERGPARDDAVVGLAVFVAYLGLQSGWPNPWGGEMPGPRYMIPALPLLAPGVAVVWRSVRLLGRVALAWSILIMALPLITLHLVPAGGTTGTQHLRNIERFGVSPTIWTLAFGGLGWAVYGATIAGVVLWLARDPALRRSPASAGAPPSPTPSSPAPP